MMASTPIIRYYDHLRLVYEVESRMKEMRRNTEIQQQQQNQPVVPGESRQNPNRKDGGSRVDSPALNNSEYLETSVTLHERPAHHPGGSDELAMREGSTVWTA